MTASEPDLVLRNARVTTLDPARPEASVIALKDGRIAGFDGAAEAAIGPHTQVVDAGRRRVIPGLNDSHLHVIRAGLNYHLELRWDGVPSLADALRRLKTRRNGHPRPNGCA